MAVVLGRGPGRWDPADASRIRMMLRATFGALFVALVPIGLTASGVGEAASIRCGATLLAAVVVAFGVSAERALREPGARRVFSVGLARALRGASGLVIVAQLVAVSGWAGAAAPGLFFFGLVALLGYGAFGFVRLIFIRPVEEE